MSTNNGKETILLLDIAAHTAVESKNRGLRKVGLSYSKFSVLQLINDNPKGHVTPSDIARSTFRARHDITTLVRRMVRAELLTIEKNPSDRRSVLITMTEKGKNSFIKGKGVMDTLSSDIIKGIPASKLISLRRSLQTIKENSTLLKKSLSNEN